MRILLVVGLLGLAAGLMAESVFAQAPPTGFAETATATMFIPIPAGADAYGSVAEAGISYGTASGSINGTFYLQEMRNYAGDATGSMQGQFVFQDGLGNSLYGNLTGAFTIDANSTSVQGQYMITGGTGANSASAGSGSFSEILSGWGGAPMLTFGGTWFNNTPAYRAPLNPPSPALTDSYIPPATTICVPLVPSYAPDSSVTNPSFFYSSPQPCSTAGQPQASPQVIIFGPGQ